MGRRQQVCKQDPTASRAAVPTNKRPGATASRAPAREVRLSAGVAVVSQRARDTAGAAESRTSKRQALHGFCDGT